MAETQKITAGQFTAGLLLNMGAGLIFLLINFPHFLERLITTNVSSPSMQRLLYAPVAATQGLVAGIVSDHPETLFQHLLAICIFLLWAFLGLAVILALKRRDGLLPVAAFGGLAAGYIALHLISWVAVGLALVIGVTINVAVWFFHIAAIVTAFLFRYGLPIALVLGAGYLLYHFRYRFLRVLAALVGAGIAAYILYKIGPAILHWIGGILLVVGKFLAWILTPVFRILGFIVAAIVVLIGAASLLAIMGNLVIAQLRAGWFAGRDRKSIILAGFAIGSAVALIALVCVASPVLATHFNQAVAESFWPFGTHSAVTVGNAGGGAIALFHATLPEKVRAFAFLYLTNLQTPIIDGFILLMTGSLAALSMAASVFRSQAAPAQEQPIYFYPREYFSIVFGLLFAVLLIFMQGMSESDG